MLTTSRRGALAVLAASMLPSAPRRARDATPISFGLNPLFLDSDIELLSAIGQYLSGKLGRPVQLVRRRTYQEITALLLSGQLDAAWVCDDPYVQHEDQLALLATPLYRGSRSTKPTSRSMKIAARNRSTSWAARSTRSPIRTARRATW